MKNLFLAIVLVIMASSCTENQMARNFGGKETVKLPAGQMLINATWRQDQLWYLTEVMPEGYEPKIKTFQEKSSYGVMEGKVTFIESK